MPIISIIGIVVLVDIGVGSMTVSNGGPQRFTVNVASSALYSVARAAYAHERVSELASLPKNEGGRDEVLRYFPNAFEGERSFLYVIVESFGVHTRPSVRDWLAKQVRTERIDGIYNLQIDKVLSRGATTAAELRRLCALSGSYRRMTRETGEGCLPRELQRAGWTTHGYHGFSESMFERKSWWPKIGVENGHFGEELGSIFGRRCGASFRGLCDDDLLPVAVRTTQSPRTFVYALTLNTHLPLEAIDIPADLSELCAAERTGPAVCSLLAHLAVGLRSLSSALETAAVPPNVLIVGDHPPPFADKHSHVQWDAARVPLLALRVKNH